MKCCVAKSCCSNWRVSGWASPPNQSLTRDMRLHGRSSYKHTMLWTHAHCSERNKPSSFRFHTQWFEIQEFIYEKYIWHYFDTWKNQTLQRVSIAEPNLKKNVQVATKNLFYIFKAKVLFGHRPHFHLRKTFIFCNNI